MSIDIHVLHAPARAHVSNPCATHLVKKVQVHVVGGGVHAEDPLGLGAICGGRDDKCSVRIGSCAPAPIRLLFSPSWLTQYSVGTSVGASTARVMTRQRRRDEKRLPNTRIPPPFKAASATPCPAGKAPPTPSPETEAKRLTLREARVGCCRYRLGLQMVRSVVGIEHYINTLVCRAEVD